MGIVLLHKKGWSSRRACPSRDGKINLNSPIRTGRLPGRHLRVRYDHDALEID